MDMNSYTKLSDGKTPAIDFFRETKEEIKETKEKINEIKWIQRIILFLTLLMAVKMYFPHFLT